MATRDRNDAVPPGQRLLYWLAEACKEARGTQPPEVIAALTGLSGPTIRRFEKAQHWPGSPDRLVAAYAFVAGLDDGRDLYKRALALWDEHGTAPLVGRRDDRGDLRTPAQRVEEEIRRGVRRDLERAERERVAASAPTQKSRAKR